jgi:hypothetical protein
MPTFADRGCRVVSSKDRQGRILGFLDRAVKQSKKIISLRKITFVDT